MFQSKTRIPFINLQLSLSEALELASPELSQHQLRTAFISWEIARAMDLEAAEIENLVLAALFHDVGALTPEEKQSIHQFEAEDSYSHCRKGAILFGQVPWLAPAAAIVLYHHHPWSERSAIPSTTLLRDSQILAVADCLERRIDRATYILHQNDALMTELERLAGDDFDPEIVEVLRQVGNREEFWLDLTSQRLYALMLHHGPLRPRDLSLDDLQDIANFFSYIIDFRSRFTATHSAGVTACACLLGELFGLTPRETKAMGVAGQLHDLGKLSIPNSILEKPGRLTRDEFAVIRRHTYHTYSVLNTIGGMGPIPEWAAFHHEKMDGSGYPFKLGKDQLSSGARIMQAADMFTALAESRPYRQTGMSREQIQRIFRDQVGQGLLDRRVTQLLLENCDDIRRAVLKRQEDAQAFFEQEFSTEEHFDGRLIA